MEKSAKNKVVRGIKIGLILLAGILILCSGYQKALRYQNINGNAVEVSATVTSVDVWEDSEGISRYDVYVEYSYKGQTYSQEVDGHRNADVGDRLSIHINPDDPMEITQETRSSAKIAIFFGA